MGRLMLFTLLFCASSILNAQHPLKKFELPYTKYKVSTKDCSKIKHHTGSVIYIPDHAFAFDQSNMPDSVDIFYRELRSPLDIITHRVPMGFELMGKKFYLESNGMFEINAKHDGQSIDIHEDRSIMVKFAMKADQIDIRMEGFQFDFDKNQWESYTNRLGNIGLNSNDSDLWGSSPVEVIEEVWEEDEMWYDEEWARKDSLRQIAFQSMEIFDFGFYNYDKIIENETYVYVNANFKTSLGSAMKSSVYVVYDDLNSVFYFDEYQWEKDFFIISNRSYNLFTIDDEGKAHILKDFPNLEAIGDEGHTFTLEAKSVVTSRAELSSLTGVQ